ncbi:DMT family transporter [Salsuginibacillus kocurii]|uniref:DMT family transporter n=1 Tax=Salsuginibacillus kocurii TaxID=427078 RepID=UPI00036BDD07|nr:multidrug efflux SMR transporter [Salsuginibacillus kocurii]
MGTWFLVISLVFALFGNLMVKLSYGFTQRLPSISAFLLFGFCIYFLTRAVQFLEIGVAYAVWSGAMVAATTVIGIVFFSEKVDKRKVSSIGLIIVGVVLLKAF